MNIVYFIDLLRTKLNAYISIYLHICVKDITEDDIVNMLEQTIQKKSGGINSKLLIQTKKQKYLSLTLENGEYYFFLKQNIVK